MKTEDQTFWTAVQQAFAAPESEDLRAERQLWDSIADGPESEAWAPPNRSMNKAARPKLCIRRGGSEDLESRKVYQTVPDPKANKESYIRVIDESGEDYLYPAEHFAPIEPPTSIVREPAPTSGPAHRSRITTHNKRTQEQNLAAKGAPHKRSAGEIRATKVNTAHANSGPPPARAVPSDRGPPSTVNTTTSAPSPETSPPPVDSQASDSTHSPNQA